LSELCDVTVKCADGKEVRAHKCILAAQSDYFNNLFSTRWRGVSRFGTLFKSTNHARVH
jgi:hypothetical protein